MDKLAPCPCGMPISELQITDSGEGGKWANVAGNCCGEWMIEFRTGNENLTSEKCLSLAIAAWNSAPRQDKTKLLSAAKAVKEIYMEDNVSKLTCGYLVTNGIETNHFKTEEEAKEFASVLISECMRYDELWDKEVEHIAIAKVTHIAQCLEKELRPDDLNEDNCSADGSHWPDEVEWRGDYVMVEVEQDKTQQLIDAAKAVIERWDSPLWKHRKVYRRAAKGCWSV